MVYRHDGQEWPVTAVKATIPVNDAATGSEIEFVPGGGSNSELNPLLLAALAAGGIAAAASGGGKEAPPPAAPSLDTKSNPDGTVTATGAAPAGSRVTVTFPDGTSNIVTAGADGKYTATSETSQNSGQVNAVVTDNNGKTSVPAVKDYVAPKSPEAISVMDEVDAVTGKIKANDLTDDARPVMSGKAEPGSTVTIYDGTTKLGTAVTDDAGSIKSVIDASGGTDDTRPEFNDENAEAGTTIRFFDNGSEIGSTIVADDGTWSFTPEIGLQQGVHRITMQAQDTAGNKSETSTTFQFEADTTPPTAPSITEIRDNTDQFTGNVTNGKTTDETNPVLSSSGAEAGSVVKIYDNGTWSFTPDSDLANGSHSFRVKAVDAAGNEDPFTTAWRITIDTTAPVAPTITQVLDDVGSIQGAVLDGKTTDDAKPTISRSGAEGGSTVKIYDNGVYLGETTANANANGTWTFTPTTDLVEGKHVFTATSTDAAGNEGNASMPWTIEVDLTPPDAKYKPVIASATDDVLPYTGEV